MGGSGGGSGSSSSTQQATIAPQLQGLFYNTGNYLTGLQQNPAADLAQFFSPSAQQIPGLTQGQQELQWQQGQRASIDPLTGMEYAAGNLAGNFGGMRGGENIASNLAQNFGGMQGAEQSAFNLSQGYGDFRSPEALALQQMYQFAGGELGSSPATQAAMKAARTPILNDLALAGLGNSTQVEGGLAGAYAPILAQEMQLRAGIIPQLTSLGAQLRGGDIAAGQLQSQIGGAMRGGDIAGANLLAQIGGAQRSGDVAGANLLAQVGATGANRQSQLINEAFQGQEAGRAIQEAQGQAALADYLRRQQLSQSLSTGILGGFPAITGGTTTTKTKEGGGK